MRPPGASFTEITAVACRPSPAIFRRSKRAAYFSSLSISRHQPQAAVETSLSRHDAAEAGRRLPPRDAHSHTMALAVEAVGGIVSWRAGFDSALPPSLGRDISPDARAEAEAVTLAFSGALLAAVARRPCRPRQSEVLRVTKMPPMPSRRRRPLCARGQASRFMQQMLPAACLR